MIYCSHPVFDLNTEEGRAEVWQLLNEYQSRSNPYDVILGFIPSSFQNSNGTVGSGYTINGGAPSVVVALDEENMPMAVAHEVGHVYGLGDEYPGGVYNLSANWPPFNYRGLDWERYRTWDREEDITVTATNPKVTPSPYGSGAHIEANLHPYEVGGRGLLQDSGSFMGAATHPLANYWITPEVWQHLFKSLTPVTTAKPLSSHLSVAVRVVEVSGWVTGAGQVNLTLPFGNYSTVEAVPAGYGDYQIRAVDSSEAVLAQTKFTPAFADLSNPPGTLGRGYFNRIIVPFPEGTAKFQVLHEGNILTEEPVSSGVPVVDVTAPEAGQIISGNDTISWNANDPDGDTLYYKVEYTPDGENWIVLGSRITETTLEQGFANLPGGDRVQVKVIASDGVNSAEALSPIFRVMPGAPRVVIGSPLTGASYTASDGVVLQGWSYDAQDDLGRGKTRLDWASSLDGHLGSGDMVCAQLSAGQHVITLTATNSFGLTASERITINVAPQPQDTPQEFPPRSNMPVDKVWTVNFNKTLAPGTVSNSTITVLDAQGDQAPVTVTAGEGGKTAIIQPPKDGYQPGQTYTIHVSKEIKSAAGVPLNRAYKMQFSIAKAGN